MKITLLWIFLLCTLSAQAYTTSDDSIDKRQDPYYLQLFLGVNKSANENLPFSEFSSYPWSFGAFFALGREFSPLWGWRAAHTTSSSRSRWQSSCTVR